MGNLYLKSYNFCLHFIRFLHVLIRIRIRNTDLDPDPEARIRIHNTALKVQCHEIFEPLLSMNSTLVQYEQPKTVSPKSMCWQSH